MKKKWGLALSSLFLFLSCRMTSERIRFIVYYGDKLEAKSLTSIDLIVVEPDLIKPISDVSTQFVAYLSLGEVHQTRRYWPSLNEAGVLLGKNPNWAGAWYVDVRSEIWQTMVIEKLIPDLIAKGFKGVFLDTVDVPAALESQDPMKYSGSRSALIGLVKKIKSKYPKFKVYPNNGFDHLVDYGDAIDGVFTEDVYTRYDFEKKIVIATPTPDTAIKEKYLDAFIKKNKKPVFNILYQTNPNDPLIQDAIKKSETKNYQWYLTTVDLMSVGVTP